MRGSTDATDEETDELLRRIDTKFGPASLAGYVRRMAGEGDLGLWLTALRAERGAAAVAHELGQARRGPECPHGQPGGANLHPQTRRPLCPLCRAHQDACRRNPLHCPTCQHIRDPAGIHRPRQETHA